MITENIVYCMDRNIRGGWVVYGKNGVRQYYDYTKAEARRKYIEDYQRITEVNHDDT